MANDFQRILSQARSDKRLLRLLIFALVFIGVGLAHESGVLLKNRDVGGELIFRYIGHLGDLLLLAFTFALLFDYRERINLFNEMAEKLGFLATASRAGVGDFALDAADMSHKKEIIESKILKVCIRGSSKFFQNNSRSRFIIDRLESGKEIEVICHKDKVNDILELREEFKRSGADVKKFQVKTHQESLMYNFLETDDGIWIKIYWLHRSDLRYSAPAFFVVANTELWKRYRRDIDQMKTVLVDGLKS